MVLPATLWLPAEPSGREQRALADPDRIRIDRQAGVLAEWFCYDRCMPSTDPSARIHEHLIAGNDLVYLPHHYVVVDEDARPNMQIDGAFRLTDGSIEFDFYLTSDTDLSLDADLNAAKVAEAKAVWGTGGVATLDSLGLNEDGMSPISLVVDAGGLTIEAVMEGLSRWVGETVTATAVRVIDGCGAWQFNVALMNSDD